MTVKELKEKLSKMDETEQVAVDLNDDSGHFLFDIVGVSSHKGTPLRTADGDAGFRAETDGPAKWTFISIEKA
ncbi:hypothetical protein SAMN05444166_6481 [Singulisphaera sp. GP187]|uniref:hypothetical protein n=1 Tax=Singulisphaera sp. GP187 TaxID=1882752 RepID=UPI000925E127|nr:hypothetical protein [Singulisphaera sp. GP187]SIO60672.1 hypothetical protein SAMN05444166_6481 [Singulisphaera sp. GP187]